MKLTLGVIAVAAVLLLIPADALGGGRSKAKVTVHLPPGGSAEYFYGLVKAKPGACRKRELEILRDPVGSGTYAPYGAGILSNRDGTWTYDPLGPILDGFYKVIAKKKSASSKACSKGVSKPFFVD